MKDKIEIIAIIIFLGFMLHPVVSRADSEVHILLTKIPGSQEWGLYKTEAVKQIEFYLYGDCKRAAWKAQRSEEAIRFRLRYKCETVTKLNADIFT